MRGPLTFGVAPSGRTFNYPMPAVGRQSSQSLDRDGRTSSPSRRGRRDQYSAAWRVMPGLPHRRVARPDTFSTMYTGRCGASGQICRADRRFDQRLTVSNRVRHQDVRYRWLESSMSPRSTIRFTRVVSTSRDITERKQASCNSRSGRRCSSGRRCRDGIIFEWI